MSLHLQGMKRSPKSHYMEAERLLDAGAEIVDRISTLSDVRRANSSNPDLCNPDLWADYTRQMNELGKKVMGIWAQAQVHAILATVDAEV